MKLIHSLAGVVVTAGLLLAASGCTRPGAAKTTETPQPSAASSVDRVTAARPERKTLKLYTSQPGRIEAFEETPLFPKVSGYVESVLVDIGDLVKKDQVLVKLWIPEMQDEREQKEALVAQAEAEVKQAEAAVQVAKAVGARVVAVDIAPWKLETASALGADAVVDSRDPKAAAKEIRKITGGGADAAFEVIGNPEVLDLATQVVKWGGRVIVVGYSEKPALLQAGRIMFRELEIKGSLGCGLQDFPRVIDLVAQGKVRLDKMVTHRFALDEINEGFQMLDKGAEGLVRAIAIP